MVKFLQVLSIAVTLLCLALIANIQNMPLDFLRAHNNARAQVGVVWEYTLAAYAQNFVNSRRSDCGLIHSNGPYGENHDKGSGIFTGTAAVVLWVAEKNNYNNYNNKGTGGQCFHYSQVVWANSLRLGFGRAQSSNGWWIISCNYYPRGNYIGKRPY